MKKDYIALYDKKIIDICLNIWLSCLVFNPDLLQAVYDQNDVEKGLQENTIAFTIFKRGLIIDNKNVRESFKESAMFICQFIKSPNLTELPILYFLRLLLNELNSIDNYWK